MSKFKQIFLLTIGALVAIFLVACSQIKTTHLQRTTEDAKTPDSSITLHYQNDQLLKQSTTIILPYEHFGIKNIEEAKERFITASKNLQGIEGITHTADYQDDRAIQSVEIDFTKADIEEVTELLGIDEAVNGKQISYKKALAAYEDLGFTEAKDSKLKN